MSAWSNEINWSFVVVIFLALEAYRLLKPDRDYYVLERKSYNQLLQPPWRGDLFGTYYSGFEEYGAAKAAFDQYESYLDLGRMNDMEHRLFAVTAKSKSAAVAGVTKGKHGTELLHSTPNSEIRRRREEWILDAKVLAEKNN